MRNKGDLLPNIEVSIRYLYRQFPIEERKWLESRRYWKDSILTIFKTSQDEKYTLGFLEIFDWHKNYKGYYINCGILPNFRNNGALSELLAKFVNYGHVVKIGSENWIYWGVHKTNKKSIKIAKHYGFKYEKDWRKTQALYKIKFGELKKNFYI